MNDENNNLNGNVLGTVDNLTSSPSEQENNIQPISDSNNVENLIDPVSNDGIQEGGQFFNVQNNNTNLNDSSNVNQSSSFTDPNVLNNNFNNTVPSFENPNSIGVTPPISLTPDSPQPIPEPPKPKKSNKIIFVIIILLALAAIGGGTYYVLRYTKLLNFNKNNISITPNNLEIDLNGSLPSDQDFASVTGMSIESCTIDKSNIDLTKEGTYSFVVTCGNISKKGEVKVIDNTPFEVSLKDVYTQLNSEITPQDFILNPVDSLKYEFVNASEVTNNLNQVGEYEIGIKVTNNNNKSKEFLSKLYVTEYKIKGFLNCYTNSQNVSNTSATMVLNNRFSIVYDEQTNENKYGGLGFEAYTFTFTDESEYTNYLALYNSGQKVVINEISGDNILFDNPFQR